MPLGGHAGAMIDTINQVENIAHATATEVNTDMMDGSIEITNTTSTVVQTDNVIGGNGNKPNRSLMTEKGK